MPRVDKQAVESFLLQVVDGCLAGVIFLVPMLMGGRHAVGQLALTTLAVAAAWAWSLRQCLSAEGKRRSTWAAPIALGGLMLVVLQVFPFSPAALARLAPANMKLLSLWNVAESEPGSLGAWSSISLTPSETVGGLVLFLDYAMLFFVVVRRIKRLEDVERLLRWCAISATAMAAFGIVQLICSNGKFFWFYQHPESDTRYATHGAFSNKNHFANFMALGIGPLVWWLQDVMHRGTKMHRGSADARENDRKTHLLGLALGTVLLAGLLSLSRGGTVAMSLALIVCVAICYLASSINGRFALVVVSAGALICAGLVIFGYERIDRRLGTLTSGSLDRMDSNASRRTIWMAACEAIVKHLPFGTGVGSFYEVYPLYSNIGFDDNVEFTHAENSYLQIGVETGAIGLALTAAAIGLCAAWCIGGARSSSPRRFRVCAAAISAGIVASAAHGLVDFVWYVPGCMAVVIVLIGCAKRVCDLASTAKDGEKRRGHDGVSRHLFGGSFSPVPVAFMALLTLAGGWMICNRLWPALAQPYWDEYRHARLLQTNAAADENRLAKWIELLENTVGYQPDHFRAQLALAETHRMLFERLQAGAENQMSLCNIRDAAIQSHFASREEMTGWMSRAVGEHWTHLEQTLLYVRRALKFSPLEGRGYLYLAELSFLRGCDPAAKQACVDQALKIRPRDGTVLYVASAEALLSGDAARWLTYAKQAFHSGYNLQKKVLDNIADATPTENLPMLIDFVVREFQPDLNGLRLLQGACEKRCKAEQLAPLVRYRAEVAKLEAEKAEKLKAGDIWLEASRLQFILGEAEDSLQCARKAVACSSSSFYAHQQLAICLLKQEIYGEAETQIRWCLRRKPNDKYLEAKYKEALKGRLEEQRRAAADGERARVR